MLKKMVCTMMVMGMVCAMGSNAFAASAQISKAVAIEVEATEKEERKSGAEKEDAQAILDAFQVVEKDDGTFELVNKKTGEKLFFAIQQSGDVKNATVSFVTIQDKK